MPKPIALLALMGTYSSEFYQAVGFTIALLILMAIMGWIWLRDELKDKP